MPRSPVLKIAAKVVTAFFYPAVLVTAACTRRIQWRGITYTILSSGQVRVEHAAPVREELQLANSSVL